MAGEMHTAMLEMNAATEDCSPCADEPGMMQNCLPTCMSAPALASQDAVRLSLRRAGYESSLEQSFSGAQSRPDPYPPKPIILA
ncbi:MAG: hypothetical protein H0T75_00015 [Rhizobiales bacterium]|nr:hypothetical protein [Hyphomicrobiales bacterium]